MATRKRAPNKTTSQKSTSNRSTPNKSIKSNTTKGRTSRRRKTSKKHDNNLFVTFLAVCLGLFIVVAIYGLFFAGNKPVDLTNDAEAIGTSVASSKPSESKDIIITESETSTSTNTSSTQKSETNSELENPTETHEDESESVKASEQTEDTLPPDITEPLVSDDLSDLTALAGIRIGIDAGHQKKGNSEKEPYAPGSTVTKDKVSSGTAGVSTGIAEHTVNLQVALLLEELLRDMGADVIMVRRTEDVNISNIERAEMMNVNNVDLCIRIHCNGSDNSSARGVLMLVPSGDYTKDIQTASIAAAEPILSAFVEATGAKNGGFSYREDLTGFNWSKIPVVLVEMGFMSNTDDDELLADPVYQRKCAEGIAEGILKWHINTNMQ